MLHPHPEDQEPVILGGVLEFTSGTQLWQADPPRTYPGTFTTLQLASNTGAYRDLDISKEVPQGDPEASINSQPGVQALLCHYHKQMLKVTHVLKHISPCSFQAQPHTSSTLLPEL